MDSKVIFDVVTAKTTVDSQYEVFVVDDSCYFGKDYNNNVIFMIPSQLERVAPMYQETRSLRFAFNKKCIFRNGDTIDSKIVHMLICKETDEDKVMAFIRLTKAFAQNEQDNDQYYLAKLFSSISALFDKERSVSEAELQGLFAELYTILYFLENSCDIADFWQSRNMMKFDFSINGIKRLEIKSTLKPSRTHHFMHEQLRSELYDIRIVSILLQKNDCGVSLGDLIEIIREKYTKNYALLMHVESLISHVDKQTLQKIRYDRFYLRENIKYFNAVDIPHFNEKTPDGVFNAEYDCNLDTSPALSEESIIDWIKEGL